MRLSGNDRAWLVDCTLGTHQQPVIKDLPMRHPHAATGERLRHHCQLNAAEISRFASLCGDHNPIHHDAAHARGTRFGGIVASGPHLSSLLMGMAATHFSQPGENGPRAMLGLDFRFRFRRAVLADRAIELSWEVVAVRDKPSLGGDLVFLVGRVRDETGEDAVKAVGKVLVRDRL